MNIPIAAAVHLLHETTRAVLASHSTQMPGYPYATAIPLVVDEKHRPLLLISALAEHTKNLLAYPRASVAVIEPRQTDVQNATRMTLVGTFEHFSPAPETLARYLRYQPAAVQYLQLDFMFFRMKVERIRFIAGVGKMGWLESAQWEQLPIVPPEVEATLLANNENIASSGIHIAGMDAFGVDFSTDEFHQRRRFESPLTSEALSAELPKLLRTLT